MPPSPIIKCSTCGMSMGRHLMKEHIKIHAKGNMFALQIRTAMKNQGKDQWDLIEYTDLTHNENETIRKARRMGFAMFWPITDPLHSQHTLSGAITYIKQHETKHTEH